MVPTCVGRSLAGQGWSKPPRRRPVPRLFCFNLNFGPSLGRMAKYGCGRLRQNGRGQMAGRRTGRKAGSIAICTAPVSLRFVVTVQGSANCASLPSGDQGCARQRSVSTSGRGRVRSPVIAISPRRISRAWRHAPEPVSKAPARRRATARSKFEWQRRECWWMPSTLKKPGLS
jgi:hypothetical protein